MLKETKQSASSAPQESDTVETTESRERKPATLQAETSPGHEAQDLEFDKLQLPSINASLNGNEFSANSPTSDEDWDLAALRLDQNFDSIIGAQQIHTAVKVRKPNSQEWFRVHPSDNWRLQTTILHLKEENEDYLVLPNLRQAVWDEIQPVMLFTAINQYGEVFIWPVRLPKGDGRTDPFMESDMVAAKEAQRKWTRRQWVPENRAHRVLVAKGLTEEPVWPEIAFQELIKKAFKDKFIRDLDHPVLKNLRGDR